MTSSPVALVTGSRKGIGRHLVGHLVQRGYRVVGCSRTPPDETLPDSEHVVADVTEESQVTSLLAGIRRRYGRLDAVVNNAGIASMNPVLLTPGSTVERIVRTNFVGTVLVSRESAKLMMPAHFGRIVNLTTVAVPMQLEGEAIYASSKSAVETFTKILARELGPSGITVNAVGPAPVDTDLTRNVPRPKIEALAARLAIGTIGTMDDVANAVDFFLKPESGAVTGQILYLGGP